ncbi:MAG: potassium-transporting ATPase subunit KdpA [Planctomycetaceae bacterium]|nr:potassium-transporting ATPase subunit KdpA [Planctomycetaceae bacterium]
MIPMTMFGCLQVFLLIIAVLVVTKPLGLWIFHVFERKTDPFGKWGGTCERLLCRICGVDSNCEQTWGQYTFSFVLFTLFGTGVLYLLQRLQYFLPLNPEKFSAVEPFSALNTAVSFATNTNWQGYIPETTMSPFVQMLGLTWQNFVSAAAGLAVAIAVIRGLTRKQQDHPNSHSSRLEIPEAGFGSPASQGGCARPKAAARTGCGTTLGNFWCDLIRGTLYILLPISTVLAILLVSQGVIQNFQTPQTITTLEGDSQTIPSGPVASQEAIKLLGTNGGGFFNANSAHPFENPTPFSNFLEMLAILAIPAALTYTFGRMTNHTRNGWVLFGAMMLLFLIGFFAVYASESQGNAAAKTLSAETQTIDQTAGNMEGKETRFGVADSSLFAVTTTGTSCGAVNATHDSFTPFAGLVLMLNMQLGEVVFGGVGAGLYGILVFALLAVFIAGLMVGRTPEYLGKKIEAREMKLVIVCLLAPPFVILGFTAASMLSPGALASLNNSGPHGFSEILYAYSSTAANNGSAFAGLNADTPWYNVTTAIAMLAGRFFSAIPMLAVAGSMAAKKTLPPSPGTFPTDGAVFLLLLVGMILIVGALTFFPALLLGPVLEHFSITG